MNNDGSRNPGRNLTKSDYKALKWSTGLEKMAQLRAAEITVLFEHSRPNGDADPWTAAYGVESYGENIAWGDMKNSIEQYYKEKAMLGSGEKGHPEYRADVNMDHVFDEQDTLAGRGLNLYCLTSPASFSCGNLVPWAFKENGTVKLLGGVTGGGSCITLPMTTAWGTSYNISGPNRLSFLKNGSYYDVDRGVEPDYVISSYEHYYGREALAEYIRSLY